MTETLEIVSRRLEDAVVEDAANGVHARRLAAEQAAKGGGQPRWLPVDLVGLAEAPRLDDRSGC